MVYQKIINLLDNTADQPTKFRMKAWVERNDELYGMYNTNRKSKFKTSLISSRLCDCSDAYILVFKTKWLMKILKI